MRTYLLSLDKRCDVLNLPEYIPVPTLIVLVIIFSCSANKMGETCNTSVEVHLSLVTIHTSILTVERSGTWFGYTVHHPLAASISRVGKGAD
jgi:hypothetical protein